MKKILSAPAGLFLVLCFFSVSGRISAQENTKSVNCVSSFLDVIQGVDQNECYYDVTLKLVYKTANTDPRACPHGIKISFDNATIRRIGNRTPNVWFNSSTQSPGTIIPFTQQQICWSRICRWGLSSPYGNIMQPYSGASTTYKVRIYVDITPNFPTTTVQLQTVQGYAWLQGSSSPGCNVFDCYKDFVFTRPANPYSIICVKPTLCDLCPTWTPGDQVLRLSPDPPAGSRIDWYKMLLPANGQCSPFPAGWPQFPFNSVPNSPTTGVTCPTGLLKDLNNNPASTCFAAVVNCGCYSYIVQKTIFVCKPLNGINIAATPALTTIAGQLHACDNNGQGWQGTLSIDPVNINCRTWIYWYKVPTSGPPVMLQSGLYDPYSPSPSLLSYITPTLHFVSPAPACSTKYSYKVILNSGVCPSVSSTIDIYLDKPTVPGTIMAALQLTGSGTKFAPVFCEKGYTSLYYSGDCTTVDYWEKSENNDPCGMDPAQWGPWIPLSGSSNGNNPSHFTNLLFKTTRYRVWVRNFACPPDTSIPLIVRIIPPLSVTLASNPPCPNICYGPVTLTAMVPCPTAYTSIIYNWYLSNVLVAAGTSNTFSANIAGDYYVVVTGAPCGSKRSNTIKVCGPPTITITGPCAICAGQSAQLHSVIDVCCLQSPINYLWSTGETIPDIVVNAPDTYGLTVTTGNCSVSASHTVIQCPSTAFTCGNSFYDPRDVGGHTYNTLQIGTQCWMKENLDVGFQISASTEQTNNNIIEKYCYADNATNCGIYGGLYQWNELMNYTPSGSGVQGICPAGWHVPTDAEWCLMENFLDPTVDCNNPVTGWRGTNAGGKLKSTGTIQAGTGLWNQPNLGAINAPPFTALPGGHRNDAAGTFGKDSYAYFWTSTESTAAKAWEHGLGTLFQKVSRYDYDKSGNISFGLSVRCVKN